MRAMACSFIIVAMLLGLFATVAVDVEDGFGAFESELGPSGDCC